MPDQVTVLGAGDAFASGGRFQAGYVLEMGGVTILMDAGPTLLASMKRAKIAPGALDVVLISHLHGDHFAGLPFLILEYLYETPLHHRITLAGPAYLRERTLLLFHNMYPETDTREIEEKLDFVLLEPGGPIDLPGKLTVHTLRTPHMVNEISLALRVSHGGKTVAFSGDTGWTGGLVELSAGSDLFLCECTYFESAALPFHLNYPEIAVKSGLFRTRHLLLTHLGREVLNRQSEVKLEMAREGLVVPL